MEPKSAMSSPARSTPGRHAGLRALAVLLAAMAMMWAALVNGQPFFTPDTQAYVRGPDVAVLKLLGARFASPWARQEPPGAHLAAAGRPGLKPAHSYDDQEVLAGRSIYYGALAWLGQVTGGFWLTVFVQGLGVAWLAEIALRASGVRSLRAYAATMALLALATPAPFFVADLMPDVWSGVAIGAMALLFAVPKRLNSLDFAALAAMTVFAAMAHNSHVLIIAGVTAAGGALWLVPHLSSRLQRSGTPGPRAARIPWAQGPRSASPSGMTRGLQLADDPRPALIVGAVALACAVGGTLLFSAMVKHSVGAPPITPPFLTARVIADGPGRLYVREHCRDHAFAVCRFADRLAGADTDGFLWDENPKTGVFAVASPADRRALATEQGRFALASTLAHPQLQAQASARNVALQLVQTDLKDFDYKPSVLASLRADLPPEHRAPLERSVAAHRGWPIGPLWAEQAVVIWLSLGVIAWSLLAGSEAAPRLHRFALLAVAGVLANTLACGVLSDLYGRYQARCIWVLPLAAAVILAERRTAPFKIRRLQLAAAA